MAGIEKVCEFSGEYPGYYMYTYKRNLIQIMPNYRKLFRGANAELILTDVEWIAKFKTGGSFTVDEWFVRQENAIFDADLTLKQLTSNWKDYVHNHNTRLCKLYTFCLKVKDEHLQGQVQGEYYNSTIDLPATIKRLKRMLRVRNLKVRNQIKKG